MEPPTASLSFPTSLSHHCSLVLSPSSDYLVKLHMCLWSWWPDNLCAISTGQSKMPFPAVSFLLVPQHPNIPIHSWFTPILAFLLQFSTKMLQVITVVSLWNWYNQEMLPLKIQVLISYFVSMAPQGLCSRVLNQYSWTTRTEVFDWSINWARDLCVWIGANFRKFHGVIEQINPTCVDPTLFTISCCYANTSYQQRLKEIVNYRQKHLF